MMRVLIVSSHALLARGLEQVLRCDPDLDVVSQVAAVDQAIALARELRPQVVVVGESAAQGSALAIVRLLAMGIRVIGLDPQRNILEAYWGGQCPVRGVEDLIEAIRGEEAFARSL